VFIERIVNGELLARAGSSLQVLLQGYALGLGFAFVFTILAMTTQIGNDLLETLTAMLNPLPAIALLPLALVWLGLGNPSIIFVLVHAVMWPVALNTHSGFQSVSNTMRMVGRNYGLTGMSYVTKILVPAAFPSILSGLKVGWAFAWRTLIAAELVGAPEGLGQMIFTAAEFHRSDVIIAGCLIIGTIAIAMDRWLLAPIEQRTIRRWGMVIDTAKET